MGLLAENVLALCNRPLCDLFIDLQTALGQAFREFFALEELSQKLFLVQTDEFLQDLTADTSN